MAPISSGPERRQRGAYALFSLSFSHVKRAFVESGGVASGRPHSCARSVDGVHRHKSEFI
jgi:hypothetical protein